jgi:dihydropteroate synthase
MAATTYCDPLASAGPSWAGALPFADTGRWFDRCRIVTLDGGRAVIESCPALDCDVADVAAITARKRFAGFGFSDGPLLMGVVNVTPDSFSDGGDFADIDAAIARGFALAEAGAAIIDVGGESTRPGAAVVPVEEELRRTVPVVRALAGAGHAVSIDTRNAAVMAAALETGARIVNDVTALTHDGDALRVVVETGAAVMLMHIQGDPGTMQHDPRYRFAPADVLDWLRDRRDTCLAAGVGPEMISVDPGIGFGKTVTHNLQILDWLGMFQSLGCAVTLGVSRKSFIGRLADVGEAKQRLPGSLAAGLAGIARGAQILRVHDVAETRQALAVWQAVDRAAEA